MDQHRQIHVWISESDYRLLREQVAVTRDSVSAQIRRMIKGERQRIRRGDGVQVDMCLAGPAPRENPQEGIGHAYPLASGRD